MYSNTKYEFFLANTTVSDDDDGVDGNDYATMVMVYMPVLFDKVNVFYNVGVRQPF